jgi:DNA-directed RNA polymerase subunit RPC12/RpoP
MTTYRFPHKCMSCGLHFNVYSWTHEWANLHDAYCPECGGQNMLAFGCQAMDQEIFQLVPAL